MNTFIYVRVSTNKQDLTKLIEECLLYAKEKKINVPNKNIIAVIASSLKSSKIRRIDDLLNAPRYSTVITTELSRIGRNSIENREIIHKLFSKKIDLKFTRRSHEIISDPRIGPLILEVFNLFAEIERERISERTKYALQILKNRGVKLGRPRIPTYVNPKIKRNLTILKEMIKSKCSISSMARLVGVHFNTMNSFIKNKIICN